MDGKPSGRRSESLQECHQHEQQQLQQQELQQNKQYSSSNSWSEGNSNEVDVPSPHSSNERINDSEQIDINLNSSRRDVETLQLLHQYALERSRLLVEQKMKTAPQPNLKDKIRPAEQRITITDKDGTILEATETITGFPPLSLLMKSIYDGVHPEDYMSLKSIKERYWDAGNLQIQTYYRRKDINGEWMWIVGKLSSIMEQPIKGLRIIEKCPDNKDVAERINKLVRIATTLAIAVEESFSWDQLKNELYSGKTYDNNAVLRAFLHCHANGDDKVPQQVMQQQVKETMEQVPQTKGTDAVSSMVREGPYVRICKVYLRDQDYLGVMKMIVLLLTGLLHVDDLAVYVLHPDNTYKDIDSFIDEYALTRKALYCHYRNQKTSQRRRKNQHEQSSSQTHAQGFTIRLNPLLDSVAVPPISCINLSHTNIGDDGMDQFCEIISACTPHLKTLDLGFCNIGEKGIFTLCRAFYKRRRRGLAGLQGLILSGNTISLKAAKDLGSALSPSANPSNRTRRSSILFHHDGPRAGYDEDDEYGTDDEDDDENDDKVSTVIPRRKEIKCIQNQKAFDDDCGIKLLHLACTSMSGSTILELMLSLSQDCEIEELDISANNIGAEGFSHIVDFLEGNGSHKKRKGSIVMPKLCRINISNNKLGNEGIAKLTRAISRRKEAGLADLHLSFNRIDSLGTGVIMNKLLQHNLVSLSLDNNFIGDSGCQLVAASLTSLHFLSRLNLSFNQIGCRGVTSLMRALLGCETITSLSISGNIMKISGATAMGYALAHHPRLAHLDLDNCCLSQVAQCHIAAGIISNRWVPMQVLNGFKLGPPLAAIGALDIFAQHFGNSECLAIRRNVQMKTNLDFLEAQKTSKASGTVNNDQMETSVDLSTVDFVTFNNCNIATFQSAYYRLLDWLSRIPFDDDELENLRRYFYDSEDESPDGLRGSDGRLNLKVRGDLLAALGSNLEKEMRENEKNFVFPVGSSVGLPLLPEDANSEDDGDEVLECPCYTRWKPFLFDGSFDARKKLKVEVSLVESFTSSDTTHSCNTNKNKNNNNNGLKAGDIPESFGQSRDSISQSGSYRSNTSTKNSTSLKARISMFPRFLEKLDLLKLNAQEMMDEERDPAQQDIIAQQFAEASLIMLRQLRYHCMNSGLDGWRQGKSRRKVLIVDDSVVTRKLVARAFEKANFIVDTAQNGEEGVSMMKDSIYDIAFMDIDMPVMNGFDATKALREWENSTRPGARQPICALTAAYVDDFEISELMKFKEAGLDVMESKPCNIPRLFKVVDDVSPMFSDLSISVTKQQS